MLVPCAFLSTWKVSELFLQSCAKSPVINPVLKALTPREDFLPTQPTHAKSIRSLQLRLGQEISWPKDGLWITYLVSSCLFSSMTAITRVINVQTLTNGRTSKRFMLAKSYLAERVCLTHRKCGGILLWEAIPPTDGKTQVSLPGALFTRCAD